MKIDFPSDDTHALVCDLLAVGVGAAADLSALDAHFDGQLSTLAARRKFEGKIGQTLLVPTFGKLQAHELLLVGTGDGSASDLRAAAGTAGRSARAQKATHLALSLGACDAAALNRWVEAVHVGNYAYEPYKAEADQTPALTQLSITSGDALGTDEGRIRAAAQAWCRDLVNAPAAEIYPMSLAKEAQALSSIPGVTVEIWDNDKLIAENCVGILAVGQGSDRRPCMIRIQYRPANAKAHICLVGKGVTFDSGGLSLKPSGGMQTMRCDMGGAATVLGITKAVAELGLPVSLDTFVGAAENMVNGNSFKLGDILTYNNGVAVEIHNTDAEGRLVLADCLLEANKVEGASHILDFATLTGACVVAIGSDFTGLFTDDDDFANDLIAAAKATDEGLWRLPLHKPYNDMLKCEWGKIKNVGGREAGATTAALFLQNFVEDKTWAHLDIAGSAFLDKAKGPYVAGGTGQMVRSITTWMASL